MERDQHADSNTHGRAPRGGKEDGISAPRAHGGGRHVAREVRAGRRGKQRAPAGVHEKARKVRVVAQADDAARRGAVVVHRQRALAGGGVVVCARRLWRGAHLAPAPLLRGGSVA